jgi:NAD(P)-dependent dehydrogenase (short-subunit alcohol dehydrogenase family)
MQAIRRVAFVTGVRDTAPCFFTISISHPQGARGIGRAIALRLASDGLNIAINDHPSASPALRETVAQLREKGVHALSVEGDVSDECSMRKNVEEVVEKLGGVDGKWAFFSLSV